MKNSRTKKFMPRNFYLRLIALAICLAAVSYQSPREDISAQTKVNGSNKKLPSVKLRKVALVQFPGKVDCNSPGHWDGDTFYFFNSAPDPFRSAGPDLFHLGPASTTKYDNQVNSGRWIEATYKDDSGTLYGWYHNEPHPVCPAK